MASDDLIKEFLIHLRQASKTEATIRTYRHILGKADRDLPYGLDIACEDEIRDYLWREGMSDSYRATTHSAVTCFFRWAAKKGLLTLDPTIEIERPGVPEGRPRVATDAEVRYLVTTPSDPYQLWAMLAAYGGLRCIEIARLDTTDVTEHTTSIHGKGNKRRTPPTHPLIWQAIQALPPGPVTDLGERDISQYFKKYCQRRGWPRLSLHRLRGWYLTHSYRATKDIFACQRNAGHSNPRTTARYIDIPYEDSAAAVMALPSFEAGRG